VQWRTAQNIHQADDLILKKNWISCGREFLIALGVDEMAWGFDGTDRGVIERRGSALNVGPAPTKRTS
jgi:hypothetical protein